MYCNILSCLWIGLSYNAYMFVCKSSTHFCVLHDNYNPELGEVIGASAIVDDDAPPIDYRDDTNRHERGQPTLTGTNPPPLPQVAMHKVRFHGQLLF
jgi:hypothetical protein